jgi:hypothetical protein
LLKSTTASSFPLALKWESFWRLMLPPRAYRPARTCSTVFWFTRYVARQMLLYPI